MGVLEKKADTGHIGGEVVIWKETKEGVEVQGEKKNRKRGEGGRGSNIRIHESVLLVGYKMKDANALLPVRERCIEKEEAFWPLCTLVADRNVP